MQCFDAIEISGMEVTWNEWRKAFLENRFCVCLVLYWFCNKSDVLSMLFGFEVLKFPVRTVAVLEQGRHFYSFESGFVNSLCYWTKKPNEGEKLYLLLGGRTNR